MDNVFTTDIRELDKLISETRAPYTILIAGHPGSGKTTLASTICYNNALRGKKCLYITFYEDKEKLYKYMERLGLNLKKVEETGYFKYIKLPVLSNIEETINMLNNILTEQPQIIVIDSITTLLEPVQNGTEKRAWLLNYFYQLPILFNGLLILITELPYGEEKIGLGSIEFIVDSIIILKHKVEDRLLVRLLEIRKTRGAPLTVAEVPFGIREGIGIRIYAPPIIEEIPPEKEEYDFICSAFREKIGHFHRGFLINVYNITSAIQGKETLILILAHLIKYDMRALVISYLLPPSTLKEAIATSLVGNGFNLEKAYKVIDKYMVFRSINPFVRSISEQALEEVSLMEEIKPDVIIFHGTHVLEATKSPQEYLKELYKQVMYLKMREMTIVRVANYISEEKFNALSTLADLTFKREDIIEDTKVDLRVLAYRRLRPPTVITGSEFIECIKESIDFIRQHASTS